MEADLMKKIFRTIILMLLCLCFPVLHIQAAQPDMSALPSHEDWNGEEPWVFVNDGVPYFDEDDITTEPFENYSDLDKLKRCGQAFANISPDTMPTEPRGKIGSVKPTGWHNQKYDHINGKYLYNRCHLIGYQLAGENANKKNLITGTRYLNVDGMLDFENLIAGYIRETKNHVIYRVTPYFIDDNLLCEGVLMEAYSVEDEGEAISFCVFAFNVQPGVEIDYATGYNKAAA